MLDVLCPLITESDIVSNELLDIILMNVVEPNKSQRKNAYLLAKELVVKCSDTLEPYIQTVGIILYTDCLILKYYVDIRNLQKSICMVCITVRCTSRLTLFTCLFLQALAILSYEFDLKMCFCCCSSSIMYWSWVKKRRDLESVGKYMISSMSSTIYVPVSFWQSYHSLNASWNQLKRLNGWVQLLFWQGCLVKEILTLQDIIHNCGKPFLEGESCFLKLVFNIVLCAGRFRHVAKLRKEAIALSCLTVILSVHVD